MKKSVYDELKRILMENLETEKELSDEQILEVIDDIVMNQCRSLCRTLKERMDVRKELFASVRRLDVLQELLEDDSITEIMVNGPEHIFIEQKGMLRRYPKKFSSEEKLMDVIQQIAGKCNRTINEAKPIVDARLSGGERVNAVISPAALNGPILTIRRFPGEPISMQKLLALGSLTEEAADFLQKTVAARYSILISGGTGGGKTTLLGALCRYIPAEERLITIEDNAELQIQKIENLVRLEAKQANIEGGVEVSIRDLIKTALRMRPDRIIVGEVRGAEAVDLLQALNTGHDGSLSTIHANSAADVVSRLEMMVLMGMSLPISAIRRQIAAGIDLIVHLGRVRDRSRKVLEIAEIRGMRNGEVIVEPVFHWNETEGLIKKSELKNRVKLEKEGFL